MGECFLSLVLLNVDLGVEKSENIWYYMYLNIKSTPLFLAAHEKYSASESKS